MLYGRASIALDSWRHYAKTTERPLVRPLSHSLYCANGYFASCHQTSGRTAVPSALTASSAEGFRPNAFRIVGATCAVEVPSETVCGLKLGCDTSSMTLVSSCAKPP